MNKIKSLLLSNFIILSHLGAFFSDSNALSIHGDFIYWQVSQDQMQYAANLPGGVQQIIDIIDGGDFPVPFAELSLIEPSFEYKPGFRIGVGYADSCSNWDAAFDWTQLHQTVNSSIANEAQGIIPLSLPASAVFGFISGDPSMFGFATGATSRWKLEFDTFDLRIGRNYSFFECATLHPFVGVKGASIKQNQNIAYLGFAMDDTPVISVTSSKNNFYGVGPSFGFNSSWELFQNFNLTSGVSASLLYGKFTVQETPYVSIDPIAIEVIIKNNKKSRLCPTVDANLGLDWSTCLMDQFHLTVAVSYEMQYWWNQWRAPASFVGSLITGGNTVQGDLMMQGLTASLNVSF